LSRREGEVPVLSRLPLIVAGLVGLVAGGAIGMSAFGEDTKTETATTVVTQEKTQTKTVRKGSSGGRPPKVTTRTQTVTVPEPSTGGPGEGGGGPVRTVSGEKSYNGKGFKQFGTLKVKKNSVLEWTNSGRVFSVISQTQLHVSSTKKRGSVRLFKGSYPQFRVAAIGSWTLKIKPR
jgi:hypothetical protein